METNKIKMLYFDWLLSRGNNYDLKTVFPDDFNSQIQKDVAQEMIEEGYEIELEGENEPDIKVDGYFNMEVSRRVLLKIEDELEELKSLYADSRNLQKDESKWQLLSQKQQDEIEDANEKGYMEIEKAYKQLNDFKKIYNNKEIVAEFLEGTLSYSVLEKKENKAKEVIQRKPISELSGENLVSASQLIAKIDKMIARIDDAIAMCNSILEMSEDHIKEETKMVEEALGEEKVQEITEKRSVVVGVDKPEVVEKPDIKTSEDSASELEAYADAVVAEEEIERSGVFIAEHPEGISEGNLKFTLTATEYDEEISGKNVGSPKLDSETKNESDKNATITKATTLKP